MTGQQVRELLMDVEYKNWKLYVNVKPYGDPDYLQVKFLAEDNTRPGWTTLQAGRKWNLSSFMTKSEIVQTALKAVLAAEEHEAREQFKYKGAAIFGPHFDVDALAEIIHKVDVRPEGVIASAVAPLTPEPPVCAYCGATGHTQKKHFQTC